MYGTPLLLRPDGGNGDPIFAGFRPGVFSLYFGDAPIYHFDREGRWQRAFLAGTHYLKGLDGSIQAIDRVREGDNLVLVLKRRSLGYTESSDLDARVRAGALDVLDALGAGRLTPQAPPGSVPALSIDEFRDALEQVVTWDAAAWFAHRERYVEAYGPHPLPLVPPDAQAAVVLQATLGHEGGVAFGRGAATEHAVRTPGELAAHARAVHRLLGRRLLQCRTIFLVGSDALREGPETTCAYLETITTTFPIDSGSPRRRAWDTSDLEAVEPLAGIDAFLDDFTTPPPGWPDWRQLRARHLRRVSLGVESGARDVRSLYHKRWANEDVRNLVGELKSAGIGVGLLVLVDAGGIEHAARHVAATAELVGTLPLGPGDLVALLDANEVRDPALTAGDLGFTPLVGPRWTEQQAELKRLLLPVRTQRGAKVAPYSLEKQIP
jgi:hypothetical protein